MRFCPMCGAAREAEQAFCSACGGPLPAPPEVIKPQPVVSIGPPAPADAAAPPTDKPPPADAAAPAPEKQAAPEPAPTTRAQTPPPAAARRSRITDDLPAAVDPPIRAPVAGAPRWFVASTAVALALIAAAVWMLVAGTPSP